MDAAGLSPSLAYRLRTAEFSDLQVAWVKDFGSMLRATQCVIDPDEMLVTSRHDSWAGESYTVMHIWAWHPSEPDVGVAAEVDVYGVRMTAHIGQGYDVRVIAGFDYNDYTLDTEPPASHVDLGIVARLQADALAFVRRVLTSQWIRTTWWSSDTVAAWRFQAIDQDGSHVWGTGPGGPIEHDRVGIRRVAMVAGIAFPPDEVRPKPFLP